MTIAGEIERVLAGNPVRSSGGRTGYGEWDWLGAVPARTMRRLTGAGYFARGGLSVDEAADIICARVPGISTPDDALAWYVSTALAELEERQADRRGETRWEELERPDDEWADMFEDDGDDIDGQVPVDVVPLALEPDELPTWEPGPDDEEPAPRFPADAPRTFYGSARPTPRRSCWDSAPDDVSPRRRREHGSTWWAIASAVRRWTR